MIAFLLMLLFSAPDCELEDGSTQSVCVWDDGSGDTVINLDYGKAWLTLK